MFRRGVILAIGIAGSVLLTGSATLQAQETAYAITIHDDRFEPSTLNVKAGVKFQLHVKNARKVAAEFENPVMLFSLGKDSMAMLRVAQKAFYLAPLPFPCYPRARSSAG